MPGSCKERGGARPFPSWGAVCTLPTKVGDKVVWKGSDEDLPAGTVGKVPSKARISVLLFCFSCSPFCSFIFTFFSLFQTSLSIFDPALTLCLWRPSTQPSGSFQVVTVHDDGDVEAKFASAPGDQKVFRWSNRPCSTWIALSTLPR